MVASRPGRDRLITPYVHWARRHRSDRVLWHREQRALELLEEAGPPGDGTFVDVGCGAGRLTAELARRWPAARVVGLDASPAQLAAAGSDHPALLVRADLEQGLPLRPGSADVVVAAEVIEHLVDPDGFCDAVAGLLRPGGVAVVTTPNLHCWMNRLLIPAGATPVFVEFSTRSTLVGAGRLARLKQGDVPVGHLRILSKGALVDLLEGSGLVVERVAGARFDEGMPRPLRPVDGLAARSPRWASGLVAVARRPPG